MLVSRDSWTVSSPSNTAVGTSTGLSNLLGTRGASLAFMAALGVVSAWGVLNISYALHYAYLYYRSEESPGGLAFPGEQSPTQRDFAYFAFTIGTSVAVSDVDGATRLKSVFEFPRRPLTGSSWIKTTHLSLCERAS